MINEKREKIKNAIIMAVIGAIAYFSLAVARNVLGVVTPQMKAEGLSEAFFGTVSSIYFISYGVGQLVNGILGEKIKARNMIFFGLLLGGISNIIFSNLIEYEFIAYIAYGCTGFFLSMIYAPLTKLSAENNEPIYASRCCLTYQVTSNLGSPAAGVVVLIGAWQTVFNVTSVFMILVAIISLLVYLNLEKKGVITYTQPKKEQESKNKPKNLTKVLIKRGIISMSLIRVLYNIVSNTLLFWLTLYMVEYLGIAENVAPSIYSLVTIIFVISPFSSMFFYELMKRRLKVSMGISYLVSCLCFLSAFFIKLPILNVVLIAFGIFSAQTGACVVSTVYCPSFRDIGMVSFSAGFLDFMSYMSSAIFSSVFASVITNIGWQNIIVICACSMFLGAFLMLPFGKIFAKRGKQEC